VQGAKRAVAAAGARPIEQGLVVEAEMQSVCLQSHDMREAITAFVEQRAPKYTGS
jgi:enoyl-CoA hydratase/carnithine racemase